MRTPPPWPQDPASVPLGDPLKAWPGDVARIGLMHRFNRLLPALQKGAA
jgi:hypothetical protein